MRCRNTASATSTCRRRPSASGGRSRRRAGANREIHNSHSYSATPAKAGIHRSAPVMLRNGPGFCRDCGLRLSGLVIKTSCSRREREDWIGNSPKGELPCANFRKVAAPVAPLAAVITFAGVVVLWRVRLEQRRRKTESPSCSCCRGWILSWSSMNPLPSPPLLVISDRCQASATACRDRRGGIPRRRPLV